MSVVRRKDFYDEVPDWIHSTPLPEEKKQRLIQEAQEIGEPWTNFVCFDDSCFACGGKLTVPFVFWTGHGKQICLHGECARALGLALVEDGNKARSADP